MKAHRGSPKLLRIVFQMYLAHQVQVQMQEMYTAIGIDISEPAEET